MHKIAEIGVPRGFHVLDAPISGGVFGARDGTLTVFVGGEKGDFDRFLPLFQSIGDHIAYMGPVGSGHVTKLVNNFIMFINFAGVCEGMAMGAKAGIHPQALLDVIKTSTGDSMYLRRTIDLLLAGEDVNSAADLAVKDVHLAVELGRELDIPIELGPLVEEILSGSAMQSVAGGSVGNHARFYAAVGSRCAETKVRVIGQLIPAMICKPPRLQLKARQCAVRHRFHHHAQPQRFTYCLGNGLSGHVRIRTAALNPNLHLVKCPLPINIYRKLAHFSETTDDVLNGARVDIHTTYNQRIVDSPDDTTFETPKCPSAFARFRFQFDLITGTVADDRHPNPAEVSDNQLALFGGFAGYRINNFADKFPFVQVYSRLRLTLKPPSSYLRRAGVIVTAGIPSGFDAMLRPRQARARLTGMDSHTDIGVGDVNPLCLGNFSEMQGVRGVQISVEISLEQITRTR